MDSSSAAACGSFPRPPKGGTPFWKVNVTQNRLSPIDKSGVTYRTPDEVYAVLSSRTACSAIRSLPLLHFQPGLTLINDSIKK